MGTTRAVLQLANDARADVHAIDATALVQTSGDIVSGCREAAPRTAIR